MDAHDLDLDRRASVAVQPGRALAERPRLFGALTAAFPVRFKPAETAAEATATIAFDRGDLDRDQLSAKGKPVLVIGAGGGGAARVEAPLLANSPTIDRRVRGISLPDRLDGPSIELPDGSTQVLAEALSGPAWTLSEKDASLHTVRSSLPELGNEQILRDLFADRALALVALIHFMRSVTQSHSFAQPPLRAALLFDDPNLRWRTYGFIDYERLLEGARTHGYHASMAMVPLDGRLQHRPTVDLFRRNPEHLSLVFHGNNHVGQELLRADNHPDALALAAQAMRRAERFESRYGLPIDRVMTPPHGMCSPSVARALGEVGFDGICAIHPLPWAERPPATRPLAGLEPAEFASDCAVIPRLHFDSADSDIGLRAFLGHPLVFYGHHEDLAQGLERLAEIAAKVRRIGEPRWCSLGEIAASNYSTRRDGDVLRVRPYANRLRVRRPEGVRELVIERPRVGDGQMTGWSAGEGPPIPFGSPHRFRGESDLVLRLRHAGEVLPGDVPPPAWSPWPVLRKVAMEARDRSLPLRS
ncbi:MAG: hypothetical protein ACRDLL_14335 [Solirubrobacterales bacterium]